MCGIGFQLLFFAYEYQDFPTPFVVETIFFPTAYFWYPCQDCWLWMYGFIYELVLFHWPVREQVGPHQLIVFWRKEASTESKGNFWTGTKYFANLIIREIIGENDYEREYKGFRMRNGSRGLWSLKSPQFFSVSWDLGSQEVDPTWESKGLESCGWGIGLNYISVKGEKTTIPAQ